MTSDHAALRAELASLPEAALRAQAALDRLFAALQPPAAPRPPAGARWLLTLAAGLLLVLL